MSSAPPRWLAARLASRTGSAHRRRGAPCQDACGAVLGSDRDGEAVQVLVVSDGHGGARYHRSDAGSRLACAVALDQAARSLAAASTADPSALGSGGTDWADWLARQLPGRIVAAWRLAVLDHRRSQPQPEAPHDEDAPWLAYGATLGVLVLTPHWWGHTGLGDWDLVRVGGAGAELISEEPDLQGGGEATFSLCMPSCERHFASRSALHRLDPQAPPFQLLLCSDGIRKSCGSDADFLILAGHLVTMGASAAAAEDSELAVALDHISREGSGDDVSAVVARWGQETGLTDMPAAPSPGQAGRFWEPLVLQPPPQAEPRSIRSPAGAAAGLHPPNDGQRLLGHHPAARRALPPWLAASLLMALVLLPAAGGVLSWRLGLGPFAPPPEEPPLLTQDRRQAIQRLVGELCRRGRLDPRSDARTVTAADAPSAAALPDRLSRIRATLAQRRSLLQSLEEVSQEELRRRLRADGSLLTARTLPLPGLSPQDPSPRAPSRQDAASRIPDPLSDLILLSRLRPSPLRAREPSATSGSTPAADPRIATIRLCPELLGELEAAAIPSSQAAGAQNEPRGPEDPNR